MNIIYAVCTFFIVYMLYEILIIHRKNKQNNIYTSTEVVILNKVLRVDTNKIKASPLTRIVALCNAFIVSITLEVVLVVSDTILLQMLFGFGMLIALICIVYPIVAFFLRKKYGKFV